MLINERYRGTDARLQNISSISFDGLRTDLSKVLLRGRRYIVLVLVFMCYIMFVFGDFTLGDSSGNLPQRLEQKRTFENWKTNELIFLRPMKQIFSPPHLMEALQAQMHLLWGRC